MDKVTGLIPRQQHTTQPPLWMNQNYWDSEKNLIHMWKLINPKINSVKLKYISNTRYITYYKFPYLNINKLLSTKCNLWEFWKDWFTVFPCWQFTHIKSMFKYSLCITPKNFGKFLLKVLEQPNMGQCLWDTVFTKAIYPPLAIHVFLKMNIVGDHQAYHFIHQNMGTVEFMTQYFRHCPDPFIINF